MKKILTLVLTSVMILSCLTGCGSSKNDEPLPGNKEDENLIVLDDSILEPVIDEKEVKAFEEYLVKYEEFNNLFDDSQYNASWSCPFGRVIIYEGKPVMDGFEPAGILEDNYGNIYVQFTDLAEAERFLNVQRENDVKCTPDEVVLSSFSPSSPLTTGSSYSAGDEMSWGSRYINARLFAELLKVTGKSKGSAIVAIVDTGCDLNYSALSSRLKVLSGSNFIETGTKPQDQHWHGTACAGVIADVTKGLNVSIMPIRSMDYEYIDGNGQLQARSSQTSLINGIYFAAANGATIINLSLGSPVQDPAIEKAVRYCASKGITVVAAAGNEATTTDYNSPAGMHDSGVIVVSAINSSQQLSWFSNYGSSVDIAAPGEGINTYSLGGGYRNFNGTSAAAPFVSAAAAMVKLLNPYFTASEVETYLTQSVKDLGPSGKDEQYGYGALQFSLNQCFILESLEVYQMPNKTEYYVGEYFDGSGLVLKGVFNHGFTGVNNKFAQLEENTVLIDYSDIKLNKPFDEVGERIIEVGYGDKSVQITVTVKERPATAYPKLDYLEQLGSLYWFHPYSAESSYEITEDNFKEYGVTYDRSKNKITLKNTVRGYLTADQSGNGLVIEVIGDCRLDFIGMQAITWYASVTFTGSGTLTIDNYNLNEGYGQILLAASMSDGCFMVEDGVTIRVKEGIFIKSSTREKNVFIPSDYKIQGKLTTTKVGIDDWYDQWCIELNMADRGVDNPDLYRTDILPDGNGYVVIGR